MSALQLITELVTHALSQDVTVWAQGIAGAADGGGGTFSKIIRALLLVGMIAFIWKPAMYMMKHGPKGSSKEWLGVTQIMLGVVLMVVVMIFIVRSA